MGYESSRKLMKQAVDLSEEAAYPSTAAMPLTYGEWGNLRDSMHDRKRPRWVTSFVVARTRGRLSGVLPIVQSTSSAIADHYFASALNALWPGADNLDGNDVAFLGTHRRFSGGAVVRSHHDRLHDEEVLGSLYAEAAASVRARGRIPISLWTPAEQLVSARRHWGVPDLTSPGDVYSIIHLNGATTWDEYVSSVGKAQRQTIRRDIRQIRACGLRAQTSEASPGLLREAACLIAAVKQANGVPEHSRITEMRLELWAQRAADRAFAFASYSSGGRLLAICLASHTDEALDLFDVGLAAAPHRHTAYVHVAFHLPLQFALSRRMDRIELGVGHPEVKHARGATQSVAWHLSDARPSPHGRSRLASRMRLTSA